MTNEIFGPPIAPPLYIDTANTEVGINTSPAFLLDIKSKASNTSPLVVRAADDTIIANFFESTGGAGRLRLYDSNGDVQSQLSTDSHSYLVNASGITIGTFNAPGSGSILTIDSTTKGIRLSNLTTTQKNNISAPLAGVVVFDTTLGKICVYNGSAWETVTSI